MSSSTPLLDSSSIVVGERHRIRFGARRRLLSHEKIKKTFLKKSSAFQAKTEFKSFTLKLASDPLRRCRNSIAGLPGSVSDVSILSLGLHSLVDTIFMPDMVLLQNDRKWR